MNDFPLPRGYGSAAGAAADIASSTDGEDEGGRIKELVAEVGKGDGDDNSQTFSRG